MHACGIEKSELMIGKKLAELEGGEAVYLLHVFP